jgi:hypothetical protein
VKTLLGVGLMVLYAFSILAWGAITPSGHHIESPCMSYHAAPTSAKDQAGPASKQSLVIR